jgi:hydroxyacylglutathione hydrolase
VHGGMTSWRQEKRPVARIERVAAEELPARLAGDERVQLLDVRERAEWEEARIPGAAFLPWHDVETVPDGLDPAAPIAVLCSSGQRAATAASLLQRLGAQRPIHVVDGGVGTWGQLGQPLERGAAGATGAGAPAAGA